MQWVTTKRVNTFTDRAYDGNPSWVVIGADRTEDEKKLIKLSSELNPVSDTVFIFPEDSPVMAWAPQVRFPGPHRLYSPPRIPPHRVASEFAHHRKAGVKSIFL